MTFYPCNKTMHEITRKRTILAACEVWSSLQTVSESTPTPPHGKRQKRGGTDSENTIIPHPLLYFYIDVYTILNNIRLYFICRANWQRIKLKTLISKSEVGLYCYWQTLCSLESPVKGYFTQHWRACISIWDENAFTQVSCCTYTHFVHKYHYLVKEIWLHVHVYNWT